MGNRRGRGGGAARRRDQAVELPGIGNWEAEAGGPELGDCQEDGRKKFIWFPTPSAKPSPKKKRKRTITEEENTGEEEDTGEAENTGEEDSTTESDHGKENEENEEEVATSDEGDESDENLKKGFKVSRRAIKSRKRQFIRDARAAAKVAKNDFIEDGYEAENDGGDSSDDEDYVLPGAKKLPKMTRGAGRRSFKSLAYR
jgi:hypothetical protein